jgi:hypothetical protein
MTHIRLFNTQNSTLEAFELGKTPPYLAISHAWSDQFFPPGIPILSSPGGNAILKVISARFPTLHHCWVDNFCILQDSDSDKAEQIPLMGSIYHEAEAVIIALKCKLGFNQDDIDAATQSLAPALEMWRGEGWAEEENSSYWARGDGRQLLVNAMKGLARLTCSSWATRIWTLQEYVLASNVLWIGSDLNPVSIPDIFFQAIPGLCDQLEIEECIFRTPGTEFVILHTHFSGMANSRLGDIERTRIMELLGNRKATVPVDEVYGIMAASGVEIKPVQGETRERAWERWCEAAVLSGHLRWLMLPPAPISDHQAASFNCAIPSFSRRHGLSSCSLLDAVPPLGPTSVKNGTFTATGRHIGSCQVLRRLGSTHRSKSGIYHRGITFCLFSKGRWALAIQLARAFGAGRYNEKQLVAVAQVMVNNHARAQLCVDRGMEANFKEKFTSNYQYVVWGDFMQLQARCIMDSINDGAGYLARIKPTRPNFELLAVVVLDRDEKNRERRLEILDFEAVTGDQRRVFMLVEVPDIEGRGLLSSNTSIPPDLTLHKAGTALPVSGDYDGLWNEMSLQRFSIGGSSCEICKSIKQRPTTLPPLNILTNREGSKDEVKA